MFFNKKSKGIKREVILNEISPQKAQEIDKFIRQCNEDDVYGVVSHSSRKPIRIYIDAIDGNMGAALCIADSIKLSKTPIETINMGTCSGNAMLVYLAGHKRYCYPNATFSYKYHNPIIESMNAEESDSPRWNRASVEEAQAAAIKSLFIEKTKITESKFNKHIDSGFWFTAQTATEQFICNEILKEHYLFN